MAAAGVYQYQAISMEGKLNTVVSKQPASHNDKRLPYARGQRKESPRICTLLTMVEEYMAVRLQRYVAMFALTILVP